MEAVYVRLYVLSQPFPISFLVTVTGHSIDLLAASRCGSFQ